MFISSRHLIVKYGIDETIARFFVDREPPKQNLYWQEKLLYLRPDAGYLFIPLIVDLLYKSGLNKEELLSEKLVTTMEEIGHIGALEETKVISVVEAANRCAELVKDGINITWFKVITAFINRNIPDNLSKLTGTFKSLRRGDVFLFSLTVLKFPESLFEKILEQWVALINVLLLNDDAEDLETDFEAGELNAYIESGLHREGLKQIEEVAEQSLAKIELTNALMAEELRRQYTEHVLAARISNLLNPAL